MSEFDKWFKAEMPNSYKKVNKERIETVIYSCAEAAWDYQQAKIELLEVQLKGAEERAKLILDHKNKMVDDLQKKYDAMCNAFIVADDCRKEWHESYMSARLERDELQARADEITNHVDINFDEDRDDDQHSYWSGYNQALRELNDILKGNKDEN